MKLLQLITPLIFLGLLSACGNDNSVEPNENLYGTWVEPQTRGEVVFRDDGTVNWQGTEGTYEFIAGRSLWGCGEMDGIRRKTCNPEISVELDEGWFSKKTFEIKGHGPEDSEPNRWKHRGRDFLRKGSFEFLTMPSQFERMPDKLASGSRNESDDFDPTTIVLTAGRGSLATSSNYLFFQEKWRFDKAHGEWGPTQSPSGETKHFEISPQLLATIDITELSLDGGFTWKNVPLPAESSMERDGLVGTDLFRVETLYEDKEVENEDGTTEVKSVCKQQDLLILDGRAEEPAWELIESYSCSLHRTFVYFLDDSIVRRTCVSVSDDGCSYSYAISYDRGLTWPDLEEADGLLYFSYGEGYSLRNVCNWLNTDAAEYPARCEDGTTENDYSLYWYDIDTQTWSSHPVDFENEFGVSPNRDGVYFQRGHEIRKWRPDGTESLITTLPSEDFEARVVGDDLYVSTIFGLWRMEL